MIDKDPFISWLLSAETPSIRHQTLTGLLEFPPDSPEVKEARQEIMRTGPVPTILARQTESGQWANEQSYYTPKYVSTHWSLMLLTELDIDGRDPRFQDGVHYMLETTASRLQERMEAGQTGFSCFWGNLLRYAGQAGLQSDQRFAQIVAYALHDLTGSHCQCEHNWHFACAWGVIRTLWGLTVIPAAERAAELTDAINSGVTFLLDSYQLLTAEYPTAEQGKVHPLWFKLNFPLFYQTDILFTLRVLAGLNILNHPGAQPALDWLETKRGRNGRWRGSSPYRQRTWQALGGRGETDRWVSLQAALILKQAGRFSTS